MKIKILFTGLITAFLICCPSYSSQVRADLSKSHETGDADKGAGKTVDLVVPLSEPLFWNVPAAVVNEDVITVEELKESMESFTAPQAGKLSRVPNPAEVLSRLITVRLIVEEAQEMGIDQLPEVRGPSDAFAKDQLVENLLTERTKDVKADKDVVDKIYRQTVRLYKLSSLLFQNEEDARKVRAQIVADGDFDKTAEQALVDGTAKAIEKGATFKEKDLMPELADVVLKMTPGSVSEVVKLSSRKEGGFVVVRLDEFSFPEDPKARLNAERQALRIAQNDVLKAYHNELAKKYVKTNKKLLDSIDFESPKPGFQKLLNDKRVITQIKGQKPVTVGDLAEAFKYKFYHGIDEAISSKKVNKKKSEVLGELVARRVLRAEAIRQGIDKTEKYKKEVREQKRSLIFGTFVQKVIAPEIKLTEEDLRAYYEAHAADYTYPEMFRLYSIPFEKEKDAQSALDNLQKGADFSWVKANAEGQITKADANLLLFEGNVLTTEGLNEDVRKTLSGARSESFRFYQAPDKRFYVLYVKELIPRKQQPFEEVRKGITEKIFEEKIQKSIEEWSKKLRESSTVKVFVPEKAEK